MDTTTNSSGVALDQIGLIIEDQQQYEYASALSLLSLARSAERIADALEQLRDNQFRNGLDVNIISGLGDTR